MSAIAPTCRNCGNSLKPGAPGKLCAACLRSAEGGSPGAATGERITDYCARRQLSLSQRLELFARVCDTLQHAHQNCIIHGDLKASNILVIEHDGRAQPGLINLRVDPFATTDFGQVCQDIYGLGLLLYELMTGQPPFEPEWELPAATVWSLVRSAAPPGLETNGRRDGAIMQALEKLLGRRYETAHIFGVEVRRYLTHGLGDAPRSICF